jgi:hypothetical protein
MVYPHIQATRSVFVIAHKIEEHQYRTHQVASE